MSPEANRLLRMAADNGTASLAERGAVAELVEAGLATKGRKHLKLTSAGIFAASQPYQPPADVGPAVGRKRTRKA